MITLPSTFPVTCHTDYVEPGSLFVVIAGYKQHGKDYIVRALEKGARHIVLQKDSLDSAIQELIEQHSATYELVDNSRKALAQLSAEHAGNPADNLKIYAVTGTKGKSSTAWMLHEIFKRAGYKSALISSVQNKIIDTHLPSRLTTPQPDYLHQFLKLAVEQGVTHLVMEAAAQAVPCHRLEGLLFDGVIFTNFSLEHLEFFPSMEDYFAAKKQITMQRKSNASLIINQDDAWLSSLDINKVIRLSREQGDARFTIESHDPLSVTIFLNNDSFTIKNKNLVGEFNAYNLTAAAVQAYVAGVSVTVIVKALSSLNAIPGRMVPFTLPNGATAFIDHAHNPASFQHVLSFLRAKAGDKKLIVLFGTGGERDAKKRPLMGEIVSRFADLIVLTTDNPRSEDPQTIVQDILAGIKQKERVQIEYDRKIAIEYAYQHAQEGDIIALLGKGCDEYQHIGDVVMPFSEAEILRSLSEL